VLPTWGQFLFASFEKSIAQTGGELLSHNGVVSIKWKWAIKLR